MGYFDRATLGAPKPAEIELEVADGFGLPQLVDESFRFVLEGFMRGFVPEGTIDGRRR